MLFLYTNIGKRIRPVGSLKECQNRPIFVADMARIAGAEDGAFFKPHLAAWHSSCRLQGERDPSEVNCQSHPQVTRFVSTSSNVEAANRPPAGSGYDHLSRRTVFIQRPNMETCGALSRGNQEQ